MAADAGVTASLHGEDALLGQTLSHYRITEKIGAGGMGDVYRAHDEHLDREVAIKVLRPGTLTDEHSRKRFHKEALALSRLSHPHIATIHGFDTQQGTDFLVMEYIPGVSLSEKLAGGPLPEKEVLRLGVQLAEGLSAAHEHGVVHRDLKPGNLRVTGDGWLKILDFGLAKLRHPVAESGATESLTETQATAGTVPYMAPEQLLGGEIDARTDIHAAGAVLYEMATGRRPFAEVERLQLVGAILHKTPPPPSAVNPAVSAELDRIIGKCLEKEPGNRYQSARELAIDLRRLQAPARTSETVSIVAGKKWERWKLGAAVAAVSALVAMVIGFNAGRIRERFARPPSAPIQSIAVLPLANLSHDPEQEYFADGMTEALITELSQISSLKVISRTSVMHYKGSSEPLPQVARELNVNGIVEGSVLRSGDRVRITAQLIQAPSDTHLWAKSYERDLRDVLRLQSEVAQAIANEIKAKVTPQEQARLARAHLINPEAHEAYLNGRYYWNLRTEEGLKKSIRHFQVAIEKDPGYALAYAGLADSYVVLAEWALMASKEAFPRAKAAALKALEMDETLAEAHVSLGAVRSDHDWDWVGADKEYKRGIELNPGYATGHQWYAEYLSAMGRHNEAIAEIKRAQELDPLSLMINAVGGYVFIYARRYDEAIAQCRRTLELNAGFYPAHLYLGWAYQGQKLYGQAISEYQKAIALEEDNPTLAEGLAWCYAASGKRTEALKIISTLNALSRRKYVSPYGMAEIYVALGDFDQGLAWLERAYEEHSWELAFLKVSPVFDPLRSDARFKDLVRRMNFPP